MNNCFEPLYQLRGTTVDKCGKDQTGKILYQINDNGFRDSVNYTQAPDYAFFGTSTVLGVGIAQENLLVSKFKNAHNYGLAGDYMNSHSMTNLKNFLNSSLYSTKTKIVFFWIERPGKENLDELITEVNLLGQNILHISQGDKHAGMINLMPSVDYDVSKTQPGIKSHAIWARTIKLILENAR